VNHLGRGRIVDVIGLIPAVIVQRPAGTGWFQAI